MNRLVRALTLLACLATPLAAGEVQYVLAPQAPPLTPGTAQVVKVFVMNDGAQSERVVIPNIIKALLVHGDTKLAIDLIPSSPGGEVTVESRAFTTIECRFAMPDDAPPGVLLVLDAQSDAPKIADASQPSVDAPVPANVDATSKQTVAEAGLVEYRPLQFSAHEPIYFLVGGDEPNGKFQFSFKYQIVPTASPLGEKAPWTTGFHLGYTQLSFWNLEGDSKPFFDNSYKPELLWIWDNIRPGGWEPISRFDLQLGLQHESNGRDGVDSRSLNIAYIRPVVTFGQRDDFFVSVGPRLWAYVGSKDDNDDIEEYRGYGDLKIVAGKGDGFQVAATGRIGSHFDKGSLQVDLSYPIRKVLFNSIDIYLHGQLFTGFGESLLDYDDSDTNFRVGISLVR